LVRDQIATEAQQRVDRAATRKGFMDEREDGYDGGDGERTCRRPPVRPDGYRPARSLRGSPGRLDRDLERGEEDLGHEAGGHQGVREGVPDGAGRDQERSPEVVRWAARRGPEARYGRPQAVGTAWLLVVPH